MIKRLRRKFVLIAALSLLVVELVILGGINAVNIYQTNRNADNLLEIIAENGGKFPDFNRPEKPLNIEQKNDIPNKLDKRKDFNEETKYWHIIFNAYFCTQK